MYHRFAASQMDRRTSSAVLRRHIEFARRHCELVTFSDLVHRCSQDAASIGRPLLALTVDDGYRDFYQYAFPVLKELGAPATVFVTAGFIEQRSWLWPDAIEYLIFRAPAVRTVLHFEGRAFALDLTSAVARRSSWDSLATAVLFDTSARARLIRALELHLGLTLPACVDSEYEGMTWNEIGEIARHGVEIGGHTWSHAFLPDLTPADLRKELIDSKRFLESRIARPVTSFAYPNGQPRDAPASLVAAVRDAEYVCATIATPPTGVTTPDWYLVGRWTAGDDLRNLGNILSGLTAMRCAFGRRFCCKYSWN